MIKAFAKSVLQGMITRVRVQLDWWDREMRREHMERRDYDQDDLVHPWLTYQTERVLGLGAGKCRPNYTWPVSSSGPPGEGVRTHAYLGHRIRGRGRQRVARS